MGTSQAESTRRLQFGPGNQPPQPSEEVLDEWRSITTLLARACGVEAALVMRGNPDSMEVMAASDFEQTPYEVGEKAPREGRLYCETVIKTQAPLTVEDAFNDPVWKGNPDTELGLASYYGLPVNWPDGESFGTICILSRAPRSPNPTDKELLERFRSVIELTLKLLVSDQALTYAATHDALTGLMNRVLFTAVAQQLMELSVRKGSQLWMIYWDLDHFKQVNDLYGHDVGDELLASVAQRSAAVTRASDAVARIGGEEFCSLVFDADRDNVERFAQRLMDSVAIASADGMPADYRPTISCGIAGFRAGETLKDWMRRSDESMYRAKRAGRHCIVFETEREPQTKNA